ncbi:hypothetical protein [Sulfurovum sp.]|uniref:hypothetical protein n=1 Tax=Sulfurovum sp. TaxID=1969726 RepID=UPI0035665482
MTFDEIRFALAVSGVENEDAQTLIEYSKKKGTDYKVLDDLLVEMGYEKVFTDDFFGWMDTDNEDFAEDYFTTEKMRHRHEWQD